MPVRCDRVVATLRGEIESWMPHEYASGIYRAAQDLINLPPEEHEAVLTRIDDIGEALYSATNLPPRHPLSRVLVPASRPVEEDNPTDDESLSEEDAMLAEQEATEESLTLEGDAIAALPAPEEPDYLPVELQEESGEMLPLEETPALDEEHAAEMTQEEMQDTEVAPDVETEVKAEPEKATVS
jgi:hypothetical protein